MTKRKLSSKEKSICEKAIKTAMADLEWAEYNLDYMDLMIGRGLMQNFKKQMSELYIKRKRMMGDAVMLKDKIKILNKQVKEGVEVKK